MEFFPEPRLYGGMKSELMKDVGDSETHTIRTDKEECVDLRKDLSVSHALLQRSGKVSFDYKSAQ